VYPDYLRVLRLVAVIALPIIAAAVAIASGLAGQNPVEVVFSALAAVARAGSWRIPLLEVVGRGGDLSGRGQPSEGTNSFPSSSAANESLPTLSAGPVVGRWSPPSASDDCPSPAGGAATNDSVGGCGDLLSMR
jgi:hypothetical protein